MTVLLNFLGQPSSGKTSIGAAVFAHLKALGVETEFVSEYAKQLCWEGRSISPFDQYAIFGYEAHQQSVLFNKVKVLIADSPVMLTAFYQYFYNKKNTLQQPCHDFYEMAEKDYNVKVINFFLNRQKKYNPNGRYQTEAEAEEVCRLLRMWLNFEGFKYTELNCPDEERLDKVMEVLKNEGVL